MVRRFSITSQLDILLPVTVVGSCTDMTSFACGLRYKLCGKYNGTQSETFCTVCMFIVVVSLLLLQRFHVFDFLNFVYNSNINLIQFMFVRVSVAVLIQLNFVIQKKLALIKMEWMKWNERKVANVLMKFDTIESYRDHSLKRKAWHSREKKTI